MSKDEKLIKETIEELRPFLNMDGGDIEFLKYDKKEKIIYVKMFGRCVNCISQDETLELGLLEAIKEKVKDVKKIVNSPI